MTGRPGDLGIHDALGVPKPVQETPRPSRQGAAHHSTHLVAPPDQGAPRRHFTFCQPVIGHRDDVPSLRRSSVSVLKGRIREHHQAQVVQWHRKEAPHQIVVLPCSAHRGVGLSAVPYPMITGSLLRHAHLHGKIWPAPFGQPLDCPITLPKAPHFRCRGPVFWLGSCSNGYLVVL